MNEIVQNVSFLVSNLALYHQLFVCLLFSVLVPHLGTATFITESIMARIAANNVLNALEGKEMISAVYKL